MNFEDYTLKAINRFGLRGQNALARELGIAGASLSEFMTGKTLPSESTMIKLAELAGCPKEEALIDLNLWRSKNDPKRHEIWLRISKMISCVAVASVFSVNAYFSKEVTPPQPTIAIYNIYIMRLFFNLLKNLLRKLSYPLFFLTKQRFYYARCVN